MTAEKNVSYSDSLSVQFQGNLMQMFNTKNCVAAASGDTNVLIKKGIADATRQNQAYDVLRHSIGKHHEKLSSLDTNGLSVIITLSSLYYNSAAFRLQALNCQDICTNFFDNCAFYLLQLYEPSSSLSSSVEDGYTWTTVRDIEAS